ncbi:hypothetical protein HELRODRAFT_189098 [Helobdella robusta]|uniref:SUEL-type lectin domain-containing protein n=1 Tax=Helobdella robusta TaxID=6412 RepID=T1FQN0_HELRO|nr:hypothetical protein HELRODRAFT_189098 [Helobdella robusta]ESN96077.1 hypothetical protein HELRODRAFT_189098 [Helobdella robusta]
MKKYSKVDILEEEHCSNEFFHPTCPQNEVVFIKTAHYGRMNIGRCLTEKEIHTYGSQSSNPKFFGCFKDVSSYLNEKCAMKKSCDVRIGELETLFEDVCLPGLKLHLNVTYYCLKEHCADEFFRPHCESGEVIFIKKAHYGRMNIGRCLTEAELEAYGSQRSNSKFFGCFKDVSSNLEKRCNMKNSCDVRIAELQKVVERVCVPGLELHLNVTYSCLKVVQLDDGCEMSATNEVKYVEASEISSRSRCASAGKSFSIEAPRGQNIKMTLQLLHQLEKKKQEGEEEEEEVMCDRVLGTIKYLNKDYMNICSNGFARDKDSLVKQEFVSSSDLIYVSLVHKAIKSNMLLIKVEAVGCRDIIQPEDTWMQRSGDEMIIGCFMTKQKWYLRCLDRVWSGVIGNCSNSYIFSSETKWDKLKPSSQNQTDIFKKQPMLVIVFICGLGFVACATIFCLGIICLRRCSARQHKNLPNYYNNPAPIANIQPAMLFQQQQQQLQQPNFTNFNDSITHEDDETTKDEGRYQVLDQEEVAKETLALV